MFDGFTDDTAQLIRLVVGKVVHAPRDREGAIEGRAVANRSSAMPESRGPAHSGKHGKSDQPKGAPAHVCACLRRQAWTTRPANNKSTGGRMVPASAGLVQ